MKTYSFPQVSEPALLRDCETVHARERGVTAEALAYLAEVDARKAYVPAGYDSMFAYCVGALRLSEQAARKRIHAARAARRFPAIFHAVAEGRLHLSGVV
ncbi:MAG: HNH endonuclease, partial [Candidatus Eisenbacteria bacterium]